MVCYISCGLAAGFLTASLYMLIFPNKDVNDMKELSNVSKDLYSKIIKERLTIYILSTIMGIVVASALGFYWGTSVPQLQKVCWMILTIFVTQILLYTIIPKSDYMLNHITNNQESKAWLNIYLSMKNKYLWSFLLGIIGYSLLCWAFTA